MIDLQIPRAPYIKGKGFLNKLIPIIMYGIPKEADSRLDPNVIGTAAWRSFWEEEIYKIKNGVNCPGIGWVPGRFYYYMNYKYMSTIKGVITPDMVDLHLEIAYLIEFAKTNHYNLLFPKARRKGISEAAHTMLIDYGWRFTYGYKGGVAAGKKTYVDDFIAKWRFADSNLPPELSTKKLVDNDDEIVAGYSIKNEYGTFEDKGTMNTIYARTMHTNPNMFKGLYLNDVISEELGEHENWFEFFSATKDCLMNGSVQEGIFCAFGTAGNVNKGSKDFKKISQEAETYNFIEFPIFAPRFYYYGGATEINRQLPAESELWKKYKAYQLIGVEDYTLAESNILVRRDKLLKSGNVKEYNEDLQNNPLNKAEMFKKTVVNNFDTNKLNEQQHAIDALSNPKYSKFKFEFEKEEKSGMLKMPLAVKAVPADRFAKDEECIWILDAEHPRKGMRDLYAAGIDSYDQDTSKTSKSLGAMCVLIRDNFINKALRKVPVAVIRTRPPRKEKFYEMCLQLAIYYDLKQQVLVDVRTPGIIQYFMDRGAEMYLAPRPRKIESPNSTQAHAYGVSINNSSKPIMVSLMQTNIYDHYNEIWFPELIDELGNYDEVEIGSDNDLADAYGIALIQDIAADYKPKDTNNTLSDMERFKVGDGFAPKRERLKSDEQDHALFGKQ